MKTVVLIAAALIIVFLPSMLMTFGIHNDYSLLSTRSGEWLGFIEAKHLLMIGRVINGILISWQGLWTNTLESLSIWRAIGFVIALLGAVFLARLSFRRGLQPMLLGPLVILYMLLPSVHLGFLWVVHMMSGPVNFLLALLAFRLFERSTDGYRLKQSPWAFWQLLVAMMLVFTSLWLYFPTSCAFLLGGFMRLLWPKQGERVLSLWFRDMIFFATLMIIYVVIDRYVIYQWVVSTTAVVNIDPEYTLGLAKTPLAKWPILWDAFKLSWLGLWNTLGQGGFWMLVLEGVTVFALLCLGGCRWSNYWYRAFMIAWGIVILVCITQMPAVLSVGMTNIKGYRVLIVPMIAVMMFKIWLIDGLWSTTSQRLVKPICIGWMLMYIFTGYVIVHQLVVRHHTELMALDTAVIGLTHGPQIKTVMIKPTRWENDLLNGQVLSEYRYMMQLKQHIQPAFDALCIKHGLLPQKYNLVIVPPNQQLPKVTPPKTIILDMQEFMP